MVGIAGGLGFESVCVCARSSFPVVKKTTANSPKGVYACVCVLDSSTCYFFSYSMRLKIVTLHFKIIGFNNYVGIYYEEIT